MTLGYRVTTQIGRVASGEVDSIFVPKAPRLNKCGVVLVHGSGNPQQFIDTGAQPASVKLAGALAAAGVACISGDFGLQAWGSNTVLSRIDAAAAALRTAVPTVRNDKIILLGGSMGGVAVARYSQLYPGKVAGVIGLIPLWDLLSFYAANPGAVQTEIAAAWGTTVGAGLPASADVLGGAKNAVGIPHMVGYSAVDNIVLPAWSLNYAKIVGADIYVTDNQYGHSDTAVAGLTVSTVGQFIVRCGG